MKIDWTKVKEGITTMDVLKEENKTLKRELNDCYKGIEQLNNIIHKAILELERYENDNEANRYVPVKETLDILRGEEE